MCNAENVSFCPSTYYRGSSGTLIEVTKKKGKTRRGFGRIEEPSSGLRPESRWVLECFSDLRLTFTNRDLMFEYVHLGKLTSWRNLAEIRESSKNCKQTFVSQISFYVEDKIMKKIPRRSSQHDLELYPRNHIDPSSGSKDMKIEKRWIKKGLRMGDLSGSRSVRYCKGKCAILQLRLL